MPLSPQGLHLWLPTVPCKYVSHIGIRLLRVLFCFFPFFHSIMLHIHSEHVTF